VRYASRQLPHCLDALRLAKRGLGALALGHLLDEPSMRGFGSLLCDPIFPNPNFDQILN
jgi:hypothetical protein